MDSERLTPYLRRRCLALRTEDRVALIAALQESLSASPRTATARLEGMAAAIAALTGQEVKRRIRKPEYVRARVVFSFVARQEGFSQVKIAQFLGLNHATISYFERRMEDAFSHPYLFKDYIELYNTFTKAIL